VLKLLPLLHAGVPPAPHDLWHSWSFEPGVLLPVVLAAAMYAAGVRRLWHRAGAGRGITRRQTGWFAGGVLALLVALVSPLDKVSLALFSAHQTHHLLHVLAAAPILVLGYPLLASVWALPTPARRRLARWWVRARGFRAVCRALGHPLVIWTAHTVALWLWHAPGLYQSALHYERIHALEHASFVGTAIPFWWLLLRPDRRRRLPFGADLVYLFAAMMQSGALGALITLSGTAWYPEHAPWTPAWGLTPLEDQELAGLIMWVPASLIYLGALAAAFSAGMTRLDRERPALAPA
jgi:cytochrome c oxidase assembly factor CtaG